MAKNRKQIFSFEELSEMQSSGYSLDDLNQIASAVDKTSYTLITLNDERLTIGETEAIERLGRAEWIKGICRSAFYVNTTRRCLNGEKIAMHSKVYL